MVLALYIPASNQKKLLLRANTAINESEPEAAASIYKQAANSLNDEISAYKSVLHDRTR
jgi:hypothetical protein